MLLHVIFNLLNALRSELISFYNELDEAWESFKICLPNCFNLVPVGVNEHQASEIM